MNTLNNLFSFFRKPKFKEDSEGNKRWYNNKGQLHSLVGAAVVFNDGTEEYWVNGEKLTVGEFQNEKIRQQIFRTRLRRGKFNPFSLVSNLGATFGCLFISLILAAYSSIGGIALNYMLDIALGRTIPWVYALIAGLILGWATVPVAIILWVLVLAGVPHPFFVIPLK